MAEQRTTSVGTDEAYVTERGPLSCISFKKTKRGRYVGFSYFDVPAESYGDGCLTGVRLASELMDHIKSGEQGFDMLSVIEGAVEALDPAHIEHSRRGAAVGFLRMIEKVLFACARAGIHEAFIEREISQVLDVRRKLEQDAAIARAEFVSRMKSAKAEKKRARQAAGGAGCSIAGAVRNAEVAHR